jgi:formylglycine-generating enzyme required for sulfatase activity
MQKITLACLGIAGCVWLNVTTAAETGGLEGYLQEQTAKEKVAAQKAAAERSAVQRDEMARERARIELVHISAGTFVMGCQDELNKECYDWEKPADVVSIAAFEMGKTEVTQMQWKAVMGSNPSVFKGCGGTCPVENVSWDDILTFIQKLNAQTGKTYRLPSEAEWEYACRASNDMNYCGGNDVNVVAWYGAYSDPVGNSGKTTNPVGRKQPNSFGLYDMSGNVWEWVQDSWHDDYKGSPTDGVAWEDKLTNLRVVRGGSWGNDPRNVRAAYRNKSAVENRSNVIGFRLARTLP